MFNARFARITRYPAPLRIGIFLAMLLGLWLPIAAPIYLIWGTENTAAIVALLFLYGVFVWLLHVWNQHIYRRSHVLKRYGLERSWRNLREFLVGLSIGWISLFSLFVMESWLGWTTWRGFPSSISRIAIEGLIVSSGVGLAEGLLFRGWLLDELSQDYSFRRALWSSSFIYAALHFVKSWEEIVRTLPSFPGLLLLGLILGWSRQNSQGRLGFSIGLHAGLVCGYYIVNVGNLTSYTNRVPVWVTGIDRNPLAGAMGLLFLILLAFGVKSFWNSKK